MTEIRLGENLFSGRSLRSRLLHSLSMSDPLRHAVAVFLVHLTVLVVVWALLPTRFKEMRSNDYKNRSSPVARNFLTGNGFREANGDLMTRYPPGHPIYLYSVFWICEKTGLPEQTTLAIVSLGLQALTGAMLFWLVAEIWSVPVGWVVSLLWLTYLPPFYLSVLGNNEIPYTPIFILSIVAFWGAFKTNRLRGYFAAGVLLGLGMLIRPFAIVLPAFLVALCMTPFLAVRPNRRLLAIVAIIAGNIVAILPWQIWTYGVTSRFYLISSVGVHGVMDGLTFAVPRPRRIDLQIPPNELKLMTSAFERWQDNRIASFGSLSEWIRDEALHDPLAFASIMARKAARTWYGTDSHKFETVLFWMQLPYLVLCAIGSYRCLRNGGDQRRIAVLCLVVIAYYWLMTIAGLSILRYMVPVMPLLLLLSSPVVERLVTRFIDLGEPSGAKAVA